MAFLLREAVPQDASVITRLIRAMADEDGYPSPISNDYTQQYLANPSSHVLLAEIKGKSVALLAYSLRPDLYHAGEVCYIEELFVEKSARRQGIAHALLQKLLTQLEQGGCPEVSLAVLPGNDPAIRLYRNVGLSDEALLLERHF